MDEQTQHTSGPLRIRKVANQMDDSGTTVFVFRDGWMAFSDAAEHGDLEANARRVGAAWNAVEGISTKTLENGVIRELEAVLKCTLGVLEHRKIDWLTTDGPLQEKCRSVLAKLRGDPNAMVIGRKRAIPSGENVRLSPTVELTIYEAQAIESLLYSALKHRKTSLAYADSKLNDDYESYRSLLVNRIHESAQLHEFAQQRGNTDG